MKNDSESGTRVDARPSDKRSDEDLIREIENHIQDGNYLYALDDLQALRSAVQQRSGDGLLPCPWCGVFPESKSGGDYFKVHHRNNCFFSRKPLAGKSLFFSEEVKFWNTRAGVSRQSNIDERMDS